MRVGIFLIGSILVSGGLFLFFMMDGQVQYYQSALGQNELLWNPIVKEDYNALILKRSLCITAAVVGVLVSIAGIVVKDNLATRDSSIFHRNKRGSIQMYPKHGSNIKYRRERYERSGKMYYVIGFVLYLIVLVLLVLFIGGVIVPSL